MADLDARFFIRRGKALVPADMIAEELVDGIPEGREVAVTLRRPRSPAHHRTFFAWLRAIVDNSDDWHDEEELLDAIKIAVGHVERRQRLNGEVYLAPRSISFASMGQDQFKRFVKRAEYVLARAGINAPGFDEVIDGIARGKRPTPEALAKEAGRAA